MIVAVEDKLSEYVMRRLLQHVLGKARFEKNPARYINCKGKGNIVKDFNNYISTAGRIPVIILIDLDKKGCAPSLRKSLLEKHNVTSVPSKFFFRIAVREVEAWLLADKVNFAKFVGISPDAIDGNPESLADPKQYLINIVTKKSKNKEIKNDIIPQGQAYEGYSYNDRLGSFVKDSWCLDNAVQRSPSLKRTRERLSELYQLYHT